MSETTNTAGTVTVQIEADASQMITTLDVLTERVAKLKAEILELNTAANGCACLSGISDAIREALPGITMQIKSDLLSELERGGRASRSLGLRD